jgi:hypothetical protein
MRSAANAFHIIPVPAPRMNDGEWEGPDKRT